MSRIAITGASGQYGRLLTDKLVALGRAGDLVLMSRTPDKLAERIEAGCAVRYGDFDKPSSLRDAFDGADILMLISGTRVGARVVQHQAAVDAAVACGLKRVVYTSFVNVQPDNPAIVAYDHRETENLCRASGLAWTFLRDAHYADAMVMMAGPGAIASGTWLSNAGDGLEAMVWREDCVDCAVAVLTSEGHDNLAYEITGPKLESFAEVAAMMSEITGCPIEYVTTDDEGMYAHFDALGIPRKPIDDHKVGGIPWNSEDMVTFGQAIREGALAIVSDDVEKLTGRPARSVRQMIEENAEFLRQSAES